MIKYVLNNNKTRICRVRCISFSRVLSSFPAPPNKPDEPVLCELIKQCVGSFHPLAQKMLFLCQLYLTRDTKFPKEEKLHCVL